ncbi:MAG TPA: amidohydrolase family protein [Patescibacteria group bacterium]|nr:amidohydrolase family protein [Patescibacteria group bacterium]
MNGSFDIVIAGGLVADGSGDTPRPRDVGIAGARIAAVDDLAGASRESTIDATGAVVAPGFIDVHSHSDIALLADPRAESGLLQGVTTEVVGNCGHGPSPMADTRAFRANLYGALPDLALDWRDLVGYLDRLEKAVPAVNVATLVPNGNLRLAVMGTDQRAATLAERRAMARLLARDLEAGAIGLSTGLEYPLEAATTQDDLDALGAVVAQHDGFHACHTRDRGEGVVRATEEALAIGRRTGVRTQIAHALPRVEASHGTLERLMAVLDRAREEVDLGWDMHTRTFAAAALGSVLPPEALTAGSPDAIAAAGRAAIARGEGLLASFARCGWDRVTLAGMSGPPGGDSGPEGGNGRTLAEQAGARGIDPIELLARVWTGAGPGRGRLMVHAQTYDEDGIARMIAAPGGMPASDSVAQSRGGPYPGVVLFGAFSWAAWTLRRLVRERRDLELGAAVARLSARPAGRAGLADRGNLVSGAAADVVVFDPESIAERATPERPLEPAVGVRHVLVNGRVAVADGRITNVRAGEVIRGGRTG